jgi:hypothetical protein
MALSAGLIEIMSRTPARSIWAYALARRLVAPRSDEMKQQWRSSRLGNGAADDSTACGQLAISICVPLGSALSNESETRISSSEKVRSALVLGDRIRSPARTRDHSTGVTAWCPAWHEHFAMCRGETDFFRLWHWAALEYWVPAAPASLEVMVWVLQRCRRSAAT